MSLTTFDAMPDEIAVVEFRKMEKADYGDE